MTISEICKEYNKTYDRLQRELTWAREVKFEKLRKRLKEKNLAGLVRKKSDGTIGEIRVTNDWRNIMFYPLTKKGKSGKRGEHLFPYIQRGIEDMFEPYTEESEGCGND